MQINKEKTVFIIDGSSFLYRAYHAIRPMSSSDGRPVQAVYGFCRMIKKIVRKFDPQYMVIAWDSAGKTVRHDMFDDYKATRQAPPSDLFEQKKLICEFAQSVGIRQVNQSGIEADDIMFSLAQDFAKKDYISVLVTSDKDMAQAVTDKIILLDPFKDAFFDEKAVEEKYGFAVKKLPFYFSLLGDSSDNIPGVKGVGPKTACGLVKQFESLEDMYERIEEVKRPRTQGLLLDSKDNAFLSRKLFLLQYYSFESALESCVHDKNLWSNARPLFESLNFSSLLKDMGGSSKQASFASMAEVAKKKEYEFITVNTRELLEKVCAEIVEKQQCAIDTETDSLKSLEANLVGISICAEPGRAYYIPVGHERRIDLPNVQLDYDVVINKLKPLFEDQSIKKYLHNAKFDNLVLYSAGISVQGVALDTMVAARLALPEQERVGLKHLSEKLLSEKMLSFDETVKKHGYKNFSQVPVDLATEYAAADAHQTLRLVPILQEALKESKFAEHYEKIEAPLLEILCTMEKTGISCDPHVLSDIGTKIDARLGQTRKALQDLIGEQATTINFSSPKQVGHLLFEQLNLPAIKKNKTGYSTSHEVLQELAKQHPVPALISTYRELEKLRTTYVESLGDYINPKTKRIHTSFSQTRVATGRLASSDPNVQNIPGYNKKFGVDVRAAFKADPGKVFIAADYSQIELRVLAYLSQDENLVQAFANHEDIHARTAAGLFEKAIEDVTRDERQVAKRINFSILYGLTPFGLSKDLGVPFSDAKKYIDRYMAQYPGVVAWMDSIVKHAQETGYVQTLWGRRRLVPGINDRNKTVFSAARRVAINTVAQGTAADLVKIAMIKLSRELHRNNSDTQLVLQIHDELVLLAPEKEVASSVACVQKTLESVVDWNIPLVVGVKSGASWADVSK